MRVYHGDPAKLAAPRPAPSPELLQLVAERYGLRVDQPRDLGGSFNLNVLVDGHVVRAYGPWISAERLQELRRIRRTLRARGIPIPDLRAAIDGAPWSAFDNYVLEVERYVNGAPMDSWERLRIGMRTLGRMHTLMADLDVRVPPPMANYLPQEFTPAATHDATAVIRAWGPTPQEERYAEIAETLARILPVMELPCQLVHGDFKDSNVLFCDAELVAVLDFDFAGVRPRVDDLALPLGYLLRTGAGLTQVRQLIDAYDSGCATPLSDQERRALPFAMARTALSFLQYLVLPGDAAYVRRLRREFNEKRGPTCEWWLRAMRETAMRERGFL
jgi:Ser/Thr protein kinase RdoA (MazF antagonist)